jgi:hypothetical protein
MCRGEGALKLLSETIRRFIKEWKDGLDFVGYITAPTRQHHPNITSFADPAIASTCYREHHTSQDSIFCWAGVI